MKTGGLNDPGFPDASQWLVYDWPFIKPDEPRGLWFCDCAESVRAIQINAVCLAAGGSWEDLRKCAAFFRVFPYIVIVCPDPDRREAMVRELRRNIADTVFYVAEDKAFCGCKSVQELRETQGLKGLDRILMYTTELPVYGLLDLADVRQPDISKIPHALTGIPNLDRRIGGLNMGELSVLTGRRGEGKSTLAGGWLLEALDQGYPVCAYSGELPAWKFKYWTSLQAAGPGNISMGIDKQSGRKIPTVTELAQRQIDEWWRRRFFLYDIGNSSTHDAETILRLFNYAHNFYGCRMFLVDNIMTARLKTSRDADYYRSQSNFVNELACFARRANVHVLLVAHPKKTDGKHLENDDVGGIGDITNAADNVFSLERNIRKGADSEAAVERVTSLAVLKNRFWGATTAQDEAIALEFDKPSKRLYRRESGPSKKYGWEFSGAQMELRDLPNEPVPFEEGA